MSDVQDKIKQIIVDELGVDEAEVTENARFIEDLAAWMAGRPDRDLVHWVAEQDDELIGVISVRIIHKLPSPEDMDGRFGYLTNSYVPPQHRNKGVGTELLAAVKNWAADEKLELLVVWPSERAYPFYQRGGYRRGAARLRAATDPATIVVWPWPFPFAWLQFYEGRFS